MPAPNKQNSDITGLSYAQEDSLKVLPAAPVWHELEPNSYGDFGGAITTIARAPIRRSRQRLKGSPTDIEVAGGFNQDLTQRNLTRLMQGFVFADALEKTKTNPFNGTVVPITSVAADGYVAASGLGGFAAGDIVLARNFTNPNNNGVSLLTAVTGTKLTVGRPLTAAATPGPVSGRIPSIEEVGHQFAVGDISMALDVGIANFVSAAFDLRTLGLNPGEWTYCDFAGNRGYARIKSVSQNTIAFDKTTFTAAVDSGAGKTVSLYYGDYLRNATVEAPELIKIRSYNIERRLGNDGNGEQAQYLEGAVANEFTLNIPGQDKLNADLSFVALNDAYRNGTAGLKNGVRIPSLGEAAYNTSLDVVRQRLSILDPATLNPTALFGYISEGTVTIANGVTVDKAVGVFGGFDVSLGDFEVGGSLTAYFATVDAVAAIRNNADVTFDTIFAHKNSAIAIDIPLLTLGGGRLGVEKGRPITLPLDQQAAQSEGGYTLGISFLNYVPNSGMPQ